jgi:crotonobetaine/carnitine-CoA ligase
VPLRQAFMVMSPGYDAFRKRFGNYRLRTGFSMTEVSMPLCCDDPPNPRTCGKPRVGPPGYDVRLVDEHDYPVPAGEAGEMVLRTSEPWTMNAGYFGQPEKTAEAWRNGWFHTGDFFTCDEDGYFYFMDRRKDAIRRRGENISSIEVEAVVDQHPAVSESAAIGIHSEAWGDEDLKICVVCREGSTLPPTDLIDFLSSRLPGFMVPRYIEFVEALPKTEATQRVMKAELRSRGVTAATWDREALE